MYSLTLSTTRISTSPHYIETWKFKIRQNRRKYNLDFSVQLKCLKIPQTTTKKIPILLL